MARARLPSRYFPGCRVFRSVPPELLGLQHWWLARLALALSESDPSVVRRLAPALGRPSQEPPSQDTCRRRVVQLARARPAVVDPERGILGLVAALGRLAGLDALETQILLFALVVATLDDDVAVPQRPLGEAELHTVVGTVLEIDRERVKAALAPGAALRTSGLLSVRASPQHAGIAAALGLSELVEDVLRAGIEPDAILDHLLPPAPPPTCTLAEFPHLEPDLALLGRHLGRTLERKNPRLLVLLHGPPGVGKSELVRALAAHHGARLHEIRHEDSDGDPLDGEERLLSFRLAQRVLARADRVMLAFEEIEDLFPTRMGPFGPWRPPMESKAFTNRTLESATVPAFFVSNTIDGIDPAVLRRFDYRLELGAPPRSTRERIVRRHVEGLPVGQGWIERAASAAELTPSEIERAARFTRGLGLEAPAEVEQALDRALAHGPSRLRPRLAAARTLRTDLSVLRTSAPLEPLVDGLRRRARGALLFSGPPGTGKSEAARELARRLDRPVREHAASDLLSKYVGESEQRLAAAFERAAQEGAVLVLDEADSFLSPRGKAQRSWEVTLVNELLLQLERHDGIVVATTNFVDGLDPAALRRFPVKIAFEPPDLAQRVALFELALDALGLPALDGPGRDAVRGTLAALPLLAPGHVAAAVQHAELSGQVHDADALLAQLAAEHAHVPGARRRAGFA